MQDTTPLSRHESEILQTVRARGSCSIVELAALLSVSDETVRRHVQPLVKKGLVHRVHGGVVLPEQEAPFRRRLGENQQAKEAIARQAASLINNGDSLFIDSGATTNYVAMALATHRNLSIVTNSIDIARTLATRNNNRVYMAGGELRSDDAASFGKSAVDFIRQFGVKRAILSIGAMNSQGEFFNFHLEEAQISQAGIQAAEQVIMVADHSKFSRKGLVRVCGLQEVDILISDKAPPKALAKAAAQTKTAIMVAK
ncbi:MAG: DeoR/GlpR transcriptional regulator [Gammaproteobacteria bacterium]|nr:DeoR/GlpR transcriptional regulator [Gammaproteobacteria bacterium]